MRTALYTVALGAALLLTGTGSAGAQEGLFTSGAGSTSRCQFPVRGRQAGRRTRFACLQSHVGDLSVGCSTILRRPSGPRGDAPGTFINSAPPPRSAASGTA